MSLGEMDAPVDCREMEPLLHGYMDSELDLSRSLQVETHLERCENCAATFEKFDALHAAFARVPYYEAPNSLRRKITAPRRLKNYRWMGMAAAIGLIGVALWRVEAPAGAGLAR